MKKKTTNKQGIKIEAIKSAGEIVRNSYINYGRQVNNSRSFPFLLDGLKKSYTRAINALYFEVPAGKLLPTHQVRGTLGRFHPHSLDAIGGVYARLVRDNLIRGNGSFGSSDILGGKSKGADPRYTEVGLGDGLRNIMAKVIHLVPTSASEINGEDLEPIYVPTPIPLSLCITGIDGLGVGARTTIPTFSYESLLTAYLKKDYNLLEIKDKDINVNLKESDFKGLWEKGTGKITYEYELTKGKRRFEIKGSPEIFSISLGSERKNSKKKTDDDVFNELVEEGKIIVENLSTSIGHLVISLAPKVKVDENWIYQYLKKKSTKSISYNIMVTDGKSCRVMGIKDWIDVTYKNYTKLLEKGNRLELEKLEFDRRVYVILPEVVKYLQKNPMADNEEIAKKLKEDVEVIRAVLQKPLSYLRKADSEGKIKEIDKKIETTKKFKPANFIKTNLVC